MKISDMDKAQLVQYMKDVTHELMPNGRYRYDSMSKTWAQAFRLARKSGYENLEMDCNKCIDAVVKWVQK
jgi:hypothetical protein